MLGQQKSVCHSMLSPSAKRAMETLTWETNKTSVQCLIIHESISRLLLSNQRERKHWNGLKNSNIRETETIPPSIRRISLTADSEGMKILWQVLWAVRARQALLLDNILPNAWSLSVSSLPGGGGQILTSHGKKTDHNFQALKESFLEELGSNKL